MDEVVSCKIRQSYCFWDGVSIEPLPWHTNYSFDYVAQFLAINYRNLLNILAAYINVMILVNQAELTKQLSSFSYNTQSWQCCHFRTI